MQNSNLSLRTKSSRTTSKRVGQLQGLSLPKILHASEAELDADSECPHNWLSTNIMKVGKLCGVIKPFSLPIHPGRQPLASRPNPALSHH